MTKQERSTQPLHVFTREFFINARPLSERNALRQRVRQRHLPVIIAFAGLCVGTVFAAEITAWSPLRLSQSPVIDGDLTDDAWHGVPPITTFRHVEPEPGAAPSERTELYLAYDAHRIYFAVVAHDRDRRRRRAILAEPRLARARAIRQREPHARLQLAHALELLRRRRHFLRHQPRPRHEPRPLGVHSHRTQHQSRRDLAVLKVVRCFSPHFFRVELRQKPARLSHAHQTAGALRSAVQTPPSSPPVSSTDTSIRSAATARATPLPAAAAPTRPRCFRRVA